MNAHIAVPEENPFYNKIWKHLTKRDMVESDLKINHIILAFKVPRPHSHEYGGVIDLLGQIGYKVNDFIIESKLKFEIGLIKTTIIKDGIKDWYV